MCGDGVVVVCSSVEVKPAVPADRRAVSRLVTELGVDERLLQDLKVYCEAGVEPVSHTHTHAHLSAKLNFLETCVWIGQNVRPSVVGPHTLLGARSRRSYEQHQVESSEYFS